MAFLPAEVDRLFCYSSKESHEYHPIASAGWRMNASRIAVITPYFGEPMSYLAKCYESVKAQALASVHFFIGDGPKAEVLPFEGIRWHRLPEATNDYGESPRRHGAQLAIAEGMDGIAFLDADNWWHPNHLETVVKLRTETRADICTSGRTIHHVDERLLGYCLTSDGIGFSDTNCTAFFGSAIRWTTFSSSVPRELKPIHDRVLWSAIQSSGDRTAHTGLYTVAYRTKFRSHYDLYGIAPPEGAYQSTAAIEDALRLWQGMGNDSLSFNHRLDRPADR